MDKLYLTLNHVYGFFTLWKDQIFHIWSHVRPPGLGRSNLTTDRASVSALPGSPTLPGLAPAVVRDKPDESGSSYENHQCYQLPAWEKLHHNCLGAGEATPHPRKQSPEEGRLLLNDRGGWASTWIMWWCNYFDERHSGMATSAVSGKLCRCWYSLWYTRRLYGIQLGQLPGQQRQRWHL